MDGTHGEMAFIIMWQNCKCGNVEYVVNESEVFSRTDGFWRGILADAVSIVNTLLSSQLVAQLFSFK